jgi:cytochrome P450
LVFLRRATESFALGGRELPAGAIVITSALVTHRDPDLFPDPTQFRPERWASVSPGPYAYLPFGAGPRRCIGASFSAQAIRIVLATLLQRARPVLSPGATVSRIVRGIVLAPKRGLPMRFVAPEERAVPARVRGDIHELITLPA